MGSFRCPSGKSKIAGILLAYCTDFDKDAVGWVSREKMYSLLQHQMFVDWKGKIIFQHPIFAYKARVL